MTIQELRVEALRAAVSIESRTHAPTHGGTMAFADSYMRWLLYGDTPTRTPALADDGQTQAFRASTPERHELACVLVEPELHGTANEALERGLASPFREHDGMTKFPNEPDHRVNHQVREQVGK